MSDQCATSRRVHPYRFQVSIVALSLWSQPGNAMADRTIRSDWLAVERYEVPAGCPGQAEFERRVRLRLRSRKAPPLLSRVRVLVRRETDGVVGALTLEEGEGRVTRRTIRGGSCAEAIEGLALILALAADVPRSDAEASEEEHTPSSEPSARQARTTKALSESRGRRRTARPQSTPAAIHYWGADVSLVLATGFAPKPSFGAQFAGELGTHVDETLVLAARAGYRGFFEDSAAGPEGTARFSYWAVVAAVCLGPDLSRRWSALGCAVGEYGRLLASGEQTERPRSRSRVWTAVGGAARVQFRVGSVWTLHFDAGALGPLSRDRFWIGRELVHEVPELVFRGELGAGVQFP